jgi:hypothetical protein
LDPYSYGIAYLGVTDKLFRDISVGYDETQLGSVAIALERFRIKHGAFPATLNEVVPEFLPALPHSYIDARVPSYELTAPDRFKIWFFGPDGDDDKGRSKQDSQDRDDNDFDISVQTFGQMP